MSELPQCWAYNTSGEERCEKRAGHAGDHAITRSWTDSECFIRTAQPQSKSPAQAFVEDAVQQQTPSKCVACQHQHKGGTCKCGCHEHIG